MQIDHAAPERRELLPHRGPEERRALVAAAGTPVGGMEDAQPRSATERANVDDLAKASDDNATTAHQEEQQTQNGNEEEHNLENSQNFGDNAEEQCHNEEVEELACTPQV